MERTQARWAKTPRLAEGPPRVWWNVHLGIGDQTLEIRAVDVASSDVGDAPMLPELLSQTLARSQPITTSPALLQTGPATRASATIPSPNETPNDVLHGVLPPSFHPARTGNSARPSPQVQLRATRHCGDLGSAGIENTLIARSGDDGAAITAKAVQRRKCTVRNCWVSTSWRATSTVRSRRSR